MKVVQLSSKVVQRLFNAADSPEFLSRGSKEVLPFFFWFFSSAFCLHFLNSCQVVGLTNDYDKLTDAQLENIVPFTSFKDAVPGKIYEINAGLLKEDMKERPKSLVYVFANWCTSKDCVPLSVYKHYADKNGYYLYLVMTSYWDLDKTLKQNIDLPLYSIDPAYYHTKYSSSYVRKFMNELMNVPLETKTKDLRMDGNIFFFNYGILDTVRHQLPLIQ